MKNTDEQVQNFKFELEKNPYDKQTAKRLTLNDSQHISRDFIKMFGCSILEYRKKLITENEKSQKKLICDYVKKMVEDLNLKTLYKIETLIIAEKELN